MNVTVTRVVISTILNSGLLTLNSEKSAKLLAKNKFKIMVTMVTIIGNNKKKICMASIF